MDRDLVNLMKASIALNIVRAAVEMGLRDQTYLNEARADFMQFYQYKDHYSLDRLLSASNNIGAAHTLYSTCMGTVVEPWEFNSLVVEVRRLDKEVQDIAASDRDAPDIADLLEEIETLKKRQPTLMYGPFA